MVNMNQRVNAAPKWYQLVNAVPKWTNVFTGFRELLLLPALTVVSIEDPFDQDDWKAWTNFTASTNIQVVGDDLTVTNPERISKGVAEKSCNCLLLKVNQIGSVTESLQA